MAYIFEEERCAPPQFLEIGRESLEEEICNPLERHFGERKIAQIGANINRRINRIISCLPEGQIARRVLLQCGKMGPETTVNYQISQYWRNPGLWAVINEALTCYKRAIFP